jgi:hypothetical protein
VGLLRFVDNGDKVMGGCWELGRACWGGPLDQLVLRGREGTHLIDVWVVRHWR